MSTQRSLSFLFLGAAAFALFGTLLSSGCSSPIPNRNPVGEAFPKVTGNSLEKVEIELPGSLVGQPAVLLVGYQQKTQFDIDRWLLGLLQSGADVQILELPTIPSLVPTLISGWIDDGMRSGIPVEDWGVVVTLYGSAAKPVARFTGTENARNTRVLVLDEAGRVIWFDDSGYSASKVLEIASLLESSGAGERAGS